MGEEIHAESLLCFGMGFKSKECIDYRSKKGEHLSGPHNAHLSDFVL